MATRLKTNKSKLERTRAQTTIRTAFYIADDMRQEANGKVTAVGLYTDSVIVAQMRSEQPEPSPEAPLVLEGFVFLVAVSGLHGRHRITIEYRDKDHAPSAPTLGRIDSDFDFADAASSASFAGRLKPFVTASFGKKSVHLFVDGDETVFHFEVRRGKLPAELVGADEQTVGKPLRKASSRKASKTRAREA